MRAVLIAACAAGLVSGVAVATIDHVSRPAVVPPTAPLTYSGVLVGSNGVPVADGSNGVLVVFFADEGATQQLCSVPEQTVGFTQGRFRVDVSSCAASLDGAGSGFVQVSVDAGGSTITIPMSPPLPQIGVVPFARNAINAGNANFATNAGSASVAATADSAQFATNAGSASFATTASTLLAAPSDQEIVERICVSGDGLADSQCTSSPCTVQPGSESGSWVTSISRFAAGGYTINVAPGEFSSSPVCTCNEQAVGSAFNAWCQIQPNSATNISVSLLSSDNSNIDGNFCAICMGPH